MSSAQHVLILGSTGLLGLAITREALSQNLHPTLFVRNPSKVPEDISGHSDVTIIQGTLASASKTLFPILASKNFTSIISALGPPKVNRTFIDLEVSTFLAALLTHLASPSYPHQKKPYILGISTHSYPSPEDRFAFFYWFATILIALFIPGHYHEVRANTTAFLDFAAIQEREGREDVKWTVYRPSGHLSEEAKGKDGERKIARAGFQGDGKPSGGMFAKREVMARWLVAQAKVVEEGVVEGGNFGLKWAGKIIVLFDV